MSQKGNKYAFLQLSDPTGIFEVTMFSDMLASTREHLEPGTALLLGVEAETREDQIRYTATGVQPLDEALEGKIREIDIHMESSAAVPKLKEFLDIEGKGHAHINLHVKVDGSNDNGRVVTMRLAGRHSLSAQARNIIRTQDGVLEISEA